MDGCMDAWTDRMKPLEQTVEPSPSAHQLPPGLAGVWSAQSPSRAGGGLSPWAGVVGALCKNSPLGTAHAQTLENY